MRDYGKGNDMKRISMILLVLCMLVGLLACGKDKNSTTASSTTTSGQIPAGPGATTTTTMPEPTGASAIPYNSQLLIGKFSKFDQKGEQSVYQGEIVFSDSGVSTRGSGIQVSGNVATIVQSGSYRVSGTCNNGQLIVAVDKLDQVHIVLNGLTLKCSSSAPFWVKSADKVTVTLAAGSQNSFEDGTTYGTSTDAPKACVYGKDSLSFNGTGSLTVVSHVNNGIASSNDLKFLGGTYHVTAVNNAIKGNDSIAILSANMTVISSDDAFKSDTLGETNKGCIYIQGGTFTVTAADDCFQASTAIDLQGGTFYLTCGGRSVNCDGTVNKTTDAVIVNQ